jgi:Ca2+-binding RTX toxin-like protein
MAQVFGTNLSDRLVGTRSNNTLWGLGSNDTLVGSAGSDRINGGTGIDTAHYASLGRAVTLLPGGRVSKSGLGIDQMNSVERVVGASGVANSINGSIGSGIASFEINLGSNQLVVNNIPFIGRLTFAVENFVNVVGTPNSDRITGSRTANFLDGFSGNDILIGGGGSDAIVGGNGRDILLGTDDVLRGSREIDRLTGGLDPDAFVLGDRRGSYYRFGGTSDYAIITDFGANDLIVLGAGESFNAQRTTSGFNLFVTRNGIPDQIAEVRTTAFIPLPIGTVQIPSGQTSGNFLVA